MPIASIAEITASSDKSFQDAIRQGMTRAGETLEGIQGAWVKEQRITCWEDRASEYRVTLKVTHGRE